MKTIPGPQGFLVITIDGEPWRKIATSIFGRRPKLPKSNAFDEYEYRRTYAYALRRISAKNYLSTELYTLMKRKAVSESIATKIVDEFLRKGYLDDAQWIQSFIRRSIAKKEGPKRIILKLQAKGVDKETAIVAVMEQQPIDLQEENIRKLLATKYKNRSLSDPKERDRVIAALLRKGYSIDSIKPLILNML